MPLMLTVIGHGCTPTIYLFAGDATTTNSYNLHNKVYYFVCSDGGMVE